MICYVIIMMILREWHCLQVIATIAVVSSTRAQGNWANITQLPYLVHVVTTVRTCTGVLIDTLWVLTAAQCFGIAKSATVITGKPTLSDKPLRIKSYEVIIHPGFNGHPSTDLALIRLRDPIELTTYTNVLQLEAETWPQGSREMYNRKCITVGYSRRDKEWILLVKNMTAQHGQEACACFKTSDKRNLVCLPEAESTLCRRDLGGPLLCANKLTAIAHSLFSLKKCYRPWKKISPDCSDVETISVYLFLCPYLDWIQQYVLHTPPKPTSCSAPQTRCSPFCISCLMLLYII